MLNFFDKIFHGLFVVESIPCSCYILITFLREAIALKWALKFPDNFMLLLPLVYIQTKGLNSFLKESATISNFHLLISFLN